MLALGLQSLSGGLLVLRLDWHLPHSKGQAELGLHCKYTGMGFVFSAHVTGAEERWGWI